MIEELQSALAPLLGHISDNLYIQAMVIVVLSFIAAWFFDKVIITGLKRFARMTRVGFDNDLFELLHSPISGIFRFWWPHAATRKTASITVNCFVVENRIKSYLQTEQQI